MSFLLLEVSVDKSCVRSKSISKSLCKYIIWRVIEIKVALYITFHHPTISLYSCHFRELTLLSIFFY